MLISLHKHIFYLFQFDCFIHFKQRGRCFHMFPKSSAKGIPCTSGSISNILDIISEHAVYVIFVCFFVLFSFIFLFTFFSLVQQSLICNVKRKRQLQFMKRESCNKKKKLKKTYNNALI